MAEVRNLGFVRQTWQRASLGILLLWSFYTWWLRPLAVMWNFVSDIGLPNPKLTQNEHRRIRLVNQITLIFSLILIVRGIFHLVQGGEVDALDNRQNVAFSLFGTSAAIASALLFNAFKLYDVSKLLIILISALAIFAISTFALGNGLIVGSIIAYMGTALIPFLFYAYRQWPLILFGISLNIIGFIVTYWLSVQTFVPQPPMDGSVTPIDESRFFWWSLVLLCILLIVRLFYVSNTRAEFRLRKTNAMLAHTHAALEKELELAGGVQKNLLPPAPPRNDHFEISVDFKPAAALAGDMYDIVVFDEHRLGVLVADVVGHGVSAALVSMMVKLSMATHARPEVSPGQLLSKMNDQLHPHMPPGDFLTAQYAIIDLNTMSLTYSNGGHPSTFLYRPSTQEIWALDPNSPLLGPVGGIHFASGKISLTPGDRILFYTDGLTEEKNPDGIEFGEEKVKQLFRETSEMTISTVHSRILNELHLFKQGRSYHDDITMIMVEIGNQ